MSMVETHHGSNIYFEISIPHNVTSVSSNYQLNELANINGCGDAIRVPLFQREYLRHSQTVEDIEKKLERASERRNSLLQEVKDRNESIVSKAMALAKLRLEKRHKAAVALKSKLETDLALKESRRKHIIDEKIELAKRKLDKVSEIKISRRHEEFETVVSDHCDKENADTLKHKFQLKPVENKCLESENRRYKSCDS